MKLIVSGIFLLAFANVNTGSAWLMAELFGLYVVLCLFEVRNISMFGKRLTK
jgi:uncharacterized membrane protein SirB2